MHPDSKLLMGQFIGRHIDKLNLKELTVLDVGSADINGSFKEYFKEPKQYHGIDIQSFKGVDQVVKENEPYPFEDNSWDIIISGSMLEHSRHPWDILKDMERIVKPGGLICNIVPWRFCVHKDAKCKYDRWRILEDGMRVLMEDANLEILDCRIHQDDTIGIGRKKQ